MLDAGGGGGYGGTNWSAASVIDMWLAIANQETTPHWQLLSGWRKSYELTLQHMAQVKNYRDNLAAAWPPEKSPAAAAYLARLDELILHLQGTYDAAVANYTAFSNATLALSSARTDLEKVVNEYLTNEGKLQTFAREQAERPKGGLQRGPEPKPPVPDGRQAELEAKARSIMYGLSTDISQAKGGLKQPLLFDDRKIVEVRDQEGQGERFAAPPIPPISPFLPDAGAASVSGSSQNHSPQPPSVMTPTSPSVGQGKVPGLILGGVDAPNPPPPPISPPNPPIGGPQTPPTASPSLPQVSPGIPTLPVGGAPRAALGEPVARSNPGGPSGAPRGVMPPGGVIGGVPGGGLGQPAAGRATSHVNPVGGLLNPGGAQGNRTSPSARANPVGLPMGRIAHAQSNPDETDATTRWDPDNPWETAEGVTPVVRPIPEQRIDPGPAIGLR